MFTTPPSKRYRTLRKLQALVLHVRCGLPRGMNKRIRENESTGIHYMYHDVTCRSSTPYFQPHGSKNVFLLTEIQIARIVFVFVRSASENNHESYWHSNQCLYLRQFLEFANYEHTCVCIKSKGPTGIPGLTLGSTLIAQAVGHDIIASYPIISRLQQPQS